MTNKLIKWLTGKEETISYNIPEQKVIVVKKAVKKAPVKKKPVKKKPVKKTTKKKPAKRVKKASKKR